MADALLDDSQFTHTLHHNDLSALTPGALLSHTLENDPSAPASSGAFRVIERGTGKYIETIGGSPDSTGRLLVSGDPNWRNYRLRAVVTPISFDDPSPGGGICGIIARYVHSADYIALVLDADGQVKLLQRRAHGFDVLDQRPLEFCLGQSLSLTLRVEGSRAHGTAGPYTGATHVSADIRFTPASSNGRIGLIADVPARFGPFSVECTPGEAARIEAAATRAAAAIVTKQKKIPKLRLVQSIPLHGLVSGQNLRIADVNGDGKPELIVSQHSAAMAQKYSMTRLTCVSVLDLSGKVLWQSGIADPAAPRSTMDLPFQVHDLFGDGGNVIVGVHGYDIQIRDGKSGKLLFSGGTPEMSNAPVGGDFKEVTSNFGKPWGDEALSMDVAALGFCNTQGSTGAREIFVKDDHHHLAVFDVGMQQLFRHRGNHGHTVWCGDLDGDGRDELIAGYSVIDDDGKRLWALPLGEFAHSVAVADLLNSNAQRRRLFLAAGEAGLFAVNAGAARPDVDALTPVGATAAFRISIAKFRADLPGLQLMTGNHGGCVSLYDSSIKLLWTRDFRASASSTRCPLNWTGRAEELLLCGASLIDGHGDEVAALPSPELPFTDTSAAFTTDGRDAILNWDERTLNIYIADDNAPISAPLYKPKRPDPRITSSAVARVSFPPDWRE